MEIFCFFMGILFIYTHHVYLPLATSLVFFITPRLSILFFFLVGLFLAIAHEWLNQPTGMPDAPVISNALVRGTIASIPVQTPNKTQFILALESIDNQPAQALIQLAWYNNAPPVHAGENWQLSVKLKKPRNFLNPGSYNYIASLASRHVQWTGYIRNKNNRLISTQLPHFNWLSVREHLGKALTKLTINRRDAGILEALTLNLTSQITQEDWDLFRRTGTTHLFGISGEHIALVSGLIFSLTKWLWSRKVSFCLRIPALYVASISGLMMAVLYSFLAGFGPPVQRALIGCFFYTIYCLGKRRFSSWQIWRYALVGVLCLEPHAVFMQGFYFSFLAVACLLLTQQRWGLKGYKGNLALQLSCLLGLLPLTLYWYAYGSINGFIANLFAIPLVGLLIVPLALITLLFCNMSWSWLLMKPLSFLVTVLFQGLALTERLAFININWSMTSMTFALALMGALFIGVVLPIKPFNWMALLWLILPLFPPKTHIPTGEALIHVLDVGQGLAVAIQTEHHVLLYDTGDQFFKGSDLGKMVILPYYNAMKITKIDTIVISHPDKDHRGGLKSVEAGIPVERLLVNNRRYYRHGSTCHPFSDWQWDGVSFHFFPITEAFKGKNNTSCILQVTTAAGRLLLTGDIEAVAEDYLVKHYAEKLASDVLIVPHHGSKTSSSYRFLLEVAPRYAIASLGFDNRFHFPHPKTLASMKSLDIALYRTDECGMVEVTLPATGSLKKPQCFTG